MGDEFFKNVRGVFRGVESRAKQMRPGSATSELLWLTAVFGLSSLPTGNFPFVKYFHPVAGGSTCGSGCGSSGGDGGGGCGGGGGGGGCGGCGG